MAKKIPALELVCDFQRMDREHWGYIWGEAGYVIELGHERVLQDGQLADRLIALTRGGENHV